MLAFKDCIYYEENVTSDEDIQVIINNINRLELMIRGLLDTEQDAIVKVGISEAVKVLEEFVKTLHH